MSSDPWYVVVNESTRKPLAGFGSVAGEVFDCDRDDSRGDGCCLSEWGIGVVFLGKVLMSLGVVAAAARTLRTVEAKAVRFLMLESSSYVQYSMMK